MSTNTPTGLGRRSFIHTGAIAAAASATLSPFQLLAANGRQRCSGYGDLVEAIDETTGLPLLMLPRGFRYLSMSWTGDDMGEGRRVPGAPDGGAAFWGPFGRVYYARNHELRYSEANPAPFADQAITYDRLGAPGGTTTVVFDAWRGQYVRTVPTLSGTIRNCAGGSTPWNSWLTCEENLSEPGGSVELEQTHGWVFEVPMHRRASARPLTGLGRFNHEAAAVDPHTGIVYETEDRGQSGLYRFVPQYYGHLASGGRLEMLRIVGLPQLDTAVGDIAIGTSFAVDWVEIVDPTRAHDVGTDGGGCFSQGFAQGGASFRRGEGIWYGNGALYFTATSGGAAGEGQVWKLDPRRDTLTLIYESPAADVLDNPDNITVSPRGGILLCEDGGNAIQKMRGLTCDGEIFDFAANNVMLAGEVNGFTGDFRGSEWAGAAFSPDGRWLFANIMNPGITFAITGPWRRGIL